MPKVHIKIPKIFIEDIDLLVKYGYFENRDEFVRESIRRNINKYTKKRIDIAVDLYKKGKISMGRAAMLAGVSYPTMKKILREYKVELKLGPKDIKEAEEEYKVLARAEQ